MRRILGTIAATSLLLLVPAASSLAANDKIKVNPFTYDPDRTGIIVSAWQPHIGLADASGVDASGLVLQKNGLTSTWAAAYAVVSGAEGQPLTELGFDYKSDGHCGAGAPRFNVKTSDGVTHFFGCTYGTHTEDMPASGWTRVRFDLGDAFPAVNPTDTVTSVAIVADEGTDITGQGTPGQSVLDNIDVNGTVVGQPGNAG